MDKRAFTLIELLVVIAILGIIASVVFVFLADRREEARIAAGKQFDSSLRTGLGFWAQGIWHFDEGAGSPTVADASGNNNTGTINGAIWQTEDTCGLEFGTCLDFDGSDDYVDVGADSSLGLQYPMSISAWINMDQLASTKGNLMSIVGRDHGTPDRQFEFRIGMDDRLHLTVYPFGSTGGQEAISASTVFTSSDIGRWIFVAITVDEARNGKLYRDGKEIGVARAVILSKP